MGTGLRRRRTFTANIGRLKNSRQTAPFPISPVSIFHGPVSPNTNTCPKQPACSSHGFVQTSLLSLCAKPSTRPAATLSRNMICLETSLGAVPAYFSRVAGPSRYRSLKCRVFRRDGEHDTTSRNNIS